MSSCSSSSARCGDSASGPSPGPSTRGRGANSSSGESTAAGRASAAASGTAGEAAGWRDDVGCSFVARRVSGVRFATARSRRRTTNAPESAPTRRKRWEARVPEPSTERATRPTRCDAAAAARPSRRHPRTNANAGAAVARPMWRGVRAAGARPVRHTRRQPRTTPARIPGHLRRTRGPTRATIATTAKALTSTIQKAETPTACRGGGAPVVRPDDVVVVDGVAFVDVRAVAVGFSGNRWISFRGTCSWRGAASAGNVDPATDAHRPITTARAAM